MPPKQGALKLNLSEDYLDKCHIYLIQAAYQAQLAVSDRDRDLAFYDDLLEMRGGNIMKGPWKGSCQLEDPLIREQHTQLHSKLSPPLQRDLLVQIDAEDPADADSAKKVESWLEFAWKEEGFPDVYDEFISNGLRDPAAVLYTGWQQEYKQERGVSYWDGHSKDDFGNKFLVPPEGRDEDTEYSEVPTIKEQVESQKAVYEVLDLADVYLYPPKQQNIDKCQGVFIRRLLSECELLDGIEEYGYDKEAVMDLIRMGPTVVTEGIGNTGRSFALNSDSNDYITRMGIDSDYRGGFVEGTQNKSDRLDRIEGINNTILTNREDGLYECREYWGYLPKLRDGEGNALLPDYLFRDRVRSMFCPAHNINFLLDFAPDQECPFFHASMIPKPGRFLGTGLVQLIQALGLSVTFMLRYTLDNAELQMTQSFVMTPDEYMNNKSWGLYPGAKFLTDNPSAANGMRSLVMPQTASVGLEMLSFLLNRGKSTIAAEGIGEMQNKVRRNPEMQNILQTADAKYGLYGYFLYRPLAYLAARRIAQELKYNPDFEATIQTSGGKITVTADDLRKKFRFSAIQISADENPETRAGRNAQMIALQQTYMQAVQVFPQWAVELWHGARQALLGMGERNPAAWIGPEDRAQAVVQNLIAQAQEAQAAAQQGAMAEGGGQSGQPSPSGGGSTIQPLAQSTLLPHLAAQRVLPTP